MNKVKGPSISKKRQKFAEDIRQKHKQYFFQFQRQTNYGQLPLIAYVPALLQEQAYEQLQEILDGLMIEDFQPINIANNKEGKDNQNASSPLPLKVIDKIFEKQTHHTSEKVRIIMLKLLNRLDLWTNQHYIKAFHLLKNSDREDMIKQISIFLERLKNRHKNQNNTTQMQDQWAFKLNETYQILQNRPLQNSEPQIFLIDILNDLISIKTEQNTLQQFIAEIYNNPILYTNLDIVVQDNSNAEFKFIRFINICNGMLGDTNQKHIQFIANKIVSMNCFENFLTILTSGSIDVVIEGMQLLAQIYNASDNAIDVCVTKYKTLERVHTFYIDHILDEVRIRNYWGISNILGSEHRYHIINHNSLLLGKIHLKFWNQKNIRTRVQVYYCYLNLWCTFTYKQFLQQFSNNQSALKFTQMLQRLTEQITNPELQDNLLQRFIFVLYSLIQFIQQAKNQSNIHTSVLICRLQQIKNILSEIYLSYKSNKGSSEDSTLSNMDKIIGMLDDGL